LEEGSQGLKIDDIFLENFKDANLIQLGKDPYFKIKAYTSYWYNLRLSSAVDLDSIGLVMELNGNGWPWEFTFKNVEAHIYDKGNKIRTGLSGTATPYLERDYPEKLGAGQIYIKPLICHQLIE
jgi:hypothetical protein